MHDIGRYLRDGEFLSAVESNVEGIEQHMALVTRGCAEAALKDDRENDYVHHHSHFHPSDCDRR